MDMTKNLTVDDITPGVKSAVNAYLMATAYAETMREAIDKIQRGVLKDFSIAKEDGSIITDPKHTYRCGSEADLEFYYEECNHLEREAGLKPDDMPDEHCPALVAEHIAVETKWLICDAAAEMLSLPFDGKELNNRLLCMGMKKYQRFIDLVVGMVVNLPDFKSPLTQEAA